MAEIAVAPCVGAWIETQIIDNVSIASESLPAWERGLKQVDDIVRHNDISRSLRGSVD